MLVTLGHCPPALWGGLAVAFDEGGVSFSRAWDLPTLDLGFQCVDPRGGQERPVVSLSSHVGQAFWWMIRDTFMYIIHIYIYFLKKDTRIIPVSMHILWNQSEYFFWLIGRKVSWNAILFKMYVQRGWFSNISRAPIENLDGALCHGSQNCNL